MAGSGINSLVSDLMKACLLRRFGKAHHGVIGAGACVAPIRSFCISQGQGIFESLDSGGLLPLPLPASNLEVGCPAPLKGEGPQGLFLAA